MSLSLSTTDKDDEITAEIHGVKLEPVSDRKLVEGLQGIMAPDVGILPPVVRWISASRRYVIFERPPTVQTIKFAGIQKRQVTENTKFQEYDLPMPWTVYALGFNEYFQPYEIFVFAATRSLQTLKDKLYLLPLPNCNMDGRYCVPDYGYGFAEDGRTLTTGINDAYQLIWDSRFNSDIMDAVNRTYSYGVPNEIFTKVVEQNGGVPAQASAKRLYTAWQTFALADVAKFKQWCPPIWNAGGKAVQLELDHLIEHLSYTERCNYTVNHMTNIIHRRIQQLRAKAV